MVYFGSWFAKVVHHGEESTVDQSERQLVTLLPQLGNRERTGSGVGLQNFQPCCMVTYSLLGPHFPRVLQPFKKWHQFRPKCSNI